jgi:hypothetical protein
VNWSASSIPRLFQCATSAVLPQHDHSTADAQTGQQYHSDQEAAIDVGDEDAIHHFVQSLISEGDETFTELAFAYDPETDTARELDRISRDEYAKLVRPGELPGKSDLIIKGNGRVIVVDHKGILEVEDADRNAQTATYALMVARAWGFDEVDVAIVYRAAWRRPTYATLNALDLAAHGDRLRRLRVDILTAREMPQMFINDGAWCRYCPAFLSGCPRQESLARRVANGADVVPFADDDEAARALDLLGRIKMLAGRIEGALKARAKDRPFSLPDGRVYGPHEKLGNRVIDGDAAYEVLREKYGQEVADKAVTRKATQKGIEEALKKAGVKGATARKDALVKQLEEAGKVKRETKVEIELHEPMKALS